MQKISMDFTKGSIPKKMLLFSWPIFFTNMLQSSYQIIDSLWVGNLLGAHALGAVALSSTVIFTVLSFIIGLNNATLTVLSQQRGAKNEEGLKESLNAFVVVLGSLSILLGIFGFIASPWILHLLGTPKEIFDLAKAYLQINFIGIIFLFGYNFIGTVLRALGDSKTPIRFVMLAVVINAILSPIMISWMDMGIHGAAWSTILSQSAAFIFGVIYSIWKANVPFTTPHIPGKKYLKAVFKMGLPGGLQMIAISGGLLAIMSIVTSFGEEVVAGIGASQRIESIIMLPAITLGSAVNSMAGQNIGANLWNRVSTIAISGIGVILVVSLVLATTIYLGAEVFIQLFIQDPESVEFAVGYLRTVVFFYPFLSINFVLNGVVRASGAMFQVLVLNLISFWALRYPLTLLFTNLYGSKGIAYGIGVSMVISCLLAILYYYFGKWKEAKIFDKELGEENEGQKEDREVKG
jgi:putative MATE family efflux protein